MKKLPSWCDNPFYVVGPGTTVSSPAPGTRRLTHLGLNAFDPSQGNLLLPRLEWRRCGGKATLRLTLFSESSLQHDAIKAKEFIATLVSIKPLPGLHFTTTREQHWPDKTGWTQLIELATKTIAEGEARQSCACSGNRPAFRKSGQCGSDDGCQSSAQSELLPFLHGL